MNLPKYIDEALTKRTKYACKLNDAMNVVDDWLDKHNIECESYDTHTGCEIYINPFSSEQRIREAIRRA